MLADNRRKLPQRLIQSLLEFEYKIIKSKTNTISSYNCNLRHQKENSSINYLMVVMGMAEAE